MDPTSTCRTSAARRPRSHADPPDDVSRPSYRWNRIVFAALLCVTIASDASAYERDFHYYTVYLLLRARGYSAQIADTLAGFSQYVDDNGQTEPIYCSASTRAYFHFAGSDAQTATPQDLLDARVALTAAFATYSAGRSTGRYLVGAKLHLLADTFSHASFTAYWNRTINCREHSLFRPCIGHADAAEHGHGPDYPYLAATTAVSAAESIYNTIPPGPETGTITWALLKPDLESVFLQQGRQQNADVRAEAVQILIMRLYNESAAYKKAKLSREQASFNTALGR
jgi:hypothetical protein